MLPVTVGEQPLLLSARHSVAAGTVYALCVLRELPLGQRFRLTTCAVALAACEVKIYPDRVFKVPSGAELATSDQLLPAARHAALVVIGVTADAGSRCSRFRECGVIRIGVDPKDMDIQTCAPGGFRHMAALTCVTTE